MLLLVNKHDNKFLIFGQNKFTQAQISFLITKAANNVTIDSLDFFLSIEITAIHTYKKLMQEKGQYLTKILHQVRSWSG